MRIFIIYIKRETLIEIKTSLGNLWPQTIQLLYFSNSQWCSFPNWRVQVELAKSAVERVELLQLFSVHDGAVWGTMHLIRIFNKIILCEAFICGHIDFSFSRYIFSCSMNDKTVVISIILQLVYSITHVYQIYHVALLLTYLHSMMTTKCLQALPPVSRQRKSGHKVINHRWKPVLHFQRIPLVLDKRCSMHLWMWKHHHLWRNATLRLRHYLDHQPTWPFTLALMVLVVGIYIHLQRHGAVEHLFSLYSST